MQQSRDFNHPKICRVEKVIDETPSVRTLIFTDDVMEKVHPGQFAMVWVPGVNELPMSVMVAPGKEKAAFTVRKHGPASTGLYNLAVGDKIGVRGPYGNSFDIRMGKLLLVGGGTGLVPLMRLVSFLNDSGENDVTVMIGARTGGEVFFEEYAAELLSKRGIKNSQIMVTTEDGSYGKKGYVTDEASKLFDGDTSFDAVYTCGPEMMMYKIVKMAVEKGCFVQASLERMMKCGVGICGSCCMGSDLVCKDGTVFDGHTLLANKEFGRSYRDKAGILQNF